MNKTVRYTAAAAAAILIAFALFFLLGNNSSQRRKKTCEALEVSYTDDYIFVTAKEVENILEEDYGAYIGQRIDSVNVSKIETLLDGKSAILKSQAYVTRDGVLHVEITQRKPLARFVKGSGGFYADSYGYIFPLQKNYAFSVPVIDGAIPVKWEEGYKGRPGTEEEARWLDSMVEMLEYMGSSKSGWSDRIVQIHAEKNGDLTMVPREGTEIFLFGKSGNYKSKFTRMDDYYKVIVPDKGEGFYSTVNVKYDGRIVCRK